MTKISHPDPVTTRVRIAIQNSRTEDGLGKALDELLAVSAKFPDALGENDDEEVPNFLVVTFHGPEKKWLSERRFFERCARFPSLRARVAKYLDHVNPKRWKTDPFRGAGFWTSMMTPAGALAAVPLALADSTYVDTMIHHLRGSDLDHETFHRALIAKLIRKHGHGDATLRLVAFRAVDGQGQYGEEDLRWLMEQGGLRSQVEVEPFAALVDRLSQRTKYRALYIANAGKGLFAREPERFAQWLRSFETRGLTFDESDRALPEAREPRKPRAWKAAWEEAASCTDRDD